MLNYRVYSAVDVADVLVRLSLEEGKPLTNLQVQKLTYIIYGYWLGFTNFQLFQDHIEAWKFGPVIPALYNRLAHYGANLIQEPILPTLAIAQNSEEYSVIKAVYERYKNLKAWELVYLTHKDGTPWSQTEAALPGGRGIISPDVVRDYYQNHMLTSAS